MLNNDPFYFIDGTENNIYRLHKRYPSDLHNGDEYVSSITEKRAFTEIYYDLSQDTGVFMGVRAYIKEEMIIIETYNWEGLITKSVYGGVFGKHLSMIREHIRMMEVLKKKYSLQEQKVFRHPFEVTCPYCLERGKLKITSATREEIRYKCICGNIVNLKGKAVI